MIFFFQGRYKVITEGKTLILEVSDVTDADAGEYAVTISNDKGEESATCKLTVLGGYMFNFCRRYSFPKYNYFCYY